MGSDVWTHTHPDRLQSDWLTNSPHISNLHYAVVKVVGVQTGSLLADDAFPGLSQLNTAGRVENWLLSRLEAYVTHKFLIINWLSLTDCISAG